MLDEPTRKAYLDAMGITEWVSPDAQPTQQSQTSTAAAQPVVAEREQPLPATESASPQAAIEQAAIESTQPQSAEIPGLKQLNQTSINGLLVVLPEGRSQLSSDARQLMSKMLNAIHFLPKETAFAVTSDASSQMSLQGIKAILVMGNEAGQALVKQSGAKIVTGTGYTELNGIKMVVSWHPEELVSHPEHKKLAWQDLKLLLELYKQAN